MSEKDNSTTVGAMMLLAGGVIGAGLALLYAPQSGMKTRKKLGRYSEKVRNEAEAKIRDASYSITDTMDDLAEKTSDLIDRSGEVAEEWRKHLLDSIDRGQKDLEKQRNELLSRWR